MQSARSSWNSGSWKSSGHAWGKFGKAKHGSDSAGERPDRPAAPPNEWKGSSTRALERRQNAKPTACGEVKMRLLSQRAQLQEAQIAALSEALRQKPVKLLDSLRDSGFGMGQIDDLRNVLKNDQWDGKPCPGSRWLDDWLSEGEIWVTEEATALQWNGNGFRCHACSREFTSETARSYHSQCKEHLKKLRNWIWKFGRPPPEDGTQPRGAGAHPDAPPAEQAKATVGEDGARAEKVPPEAASGANIGKFSKTKLSPSQLMGQASEFAQASSAAAKRKLLQYRDSLSEDQRHALIEKIGLRRANDISDKHTFRSVFEAHVYKWICQVDDEQWLWREPTFSWLAGFYWHPESTSLGLNGPRHSSCYCHLCEVECYDDHDAYTIHLAGRRHAESFYQWVERRGATPIPSSCSRCPEQDHRVEERRANGEPPLDLHCRRPAGAPPAELPQETEPPTGFSSIHSEDVGRPLSGRYAAFVVRIPPADGSLSKARHGKRHGGAPTAEPPVRVRVASSQLRIGCHVGKYPKRGPKRWGIDLQAPVDVETEGPGASLWRSLAVPLQGDKVAEGSTLEFGVLLQHSDKEEEEEEAGKFTLKVPPVGCVAVSVVEVPAQAAGKWWSGDWVQTVETRVVGLRDFVASGQVEAFGGAEALRGSQRGFQLATEEIMISFLLYLPASLVPAPTLLFFHGDLPRDSLNCPMPGVAYFCEQYGPANVCANKRRKGEHAVRSFVVVTPTSPPEHWWFRHPAVHDAGGYVPAVERWFRKLVAWLEEDLRVSLPCSTAPNGGLRLAGQSMGGYAALELARAMPEKVAAVAVGAPCFDAFRLDWLAGRILNVPLWILIGRQDTMCAFEECASLALKLRDRGARCVRLTSFGIKGHNEACKALEQPWLYSWMLHPLADL